jgi:hypothetical protein
MVDWLNDFKKSFTVVFGMLLCGYYRCKVLFETTCISVYRDQISKMACKPQCSRLRIAYNAKYMYTQVTNFRSAALLVKPSHPDSQDIAEHFYQI